LIWVKKTVLVKPGRPLSQLAAVAQAPSPPAPDQTLVIVPPREQTTEAANNARAVNNKANGQCGRGGVVLIGRVGEVDFWLKVINGILFREGLIFHVPKRMRYDSGFVVP
jgi:hypothetical protein